MLSLPGSPIRGRRVLKTRRVSFPGHATVGDFPFSAYPISGGSPVVQAATCSQADVQTALNAAADGDRVILPQGAATWTSTVTAPTRALLIFGAGVGLTVISDGVDKSGSPPNAFAWTVPDTGPSRLSGIEMVGGLQPGLSQYMMEFSGNSSLFRVDNNKFVVRNSSPIRGLNYLRGVIDHNVFDMTHGWDGHGIYWHHNTWSGYPSTDYGDASWAAASTMGTTDALFIEDNTFTGQAVPGSAFNWAYDGWMGARIVFRHNSLFNLFFANHGTDTGGRWRGIRHYEVYNNSFAYDTFQFPIFVSARGGTGRIFNNVGSLANGAFVNAFLDAECHRRSVPGMPTPYFGACTGSSIYDGNKDATGYP